MASASLQWFKAIVISFCHVDRHFWTRHDVHSLTAHLFTITHFCISEFSRKPKLNPQSFYFNHCNGKVSNFPHFLKDEDSKWSLDNCEKEIQLPCEHELEYNAPFKWYFCMKFNDMENAHSIMLNGKRRCTAIFYIIPIEIYEWSEYRK